MAFHETFWAISGTAAPVIALAIVVSQGTLGDHETEWLEVRSRIKHELKDMEAAAKQVFGEMGKLLRDGESADAPSDGESADAPSDSANLDEVSNTVLAAVVDGFAEIMTGAGRKSFEGTDRWMSRILRGIRVVQGTNLIFQAALLCVSLTSVAYQFNLVSPIAAIVVAVLGILCLALTTALVYAFKSLVNALRISKTNLRPPNLKLPEPPEPSTEDLAKHLADTLNVSVDALSPGSSDWFGLSRRLEHTKRRQE